MKLLVYFFSIAIILLNNFSYPQKSQYAGHEIFIYTEGYNQYQSYVKFWLENVGTVWDQDYNASQQSLQNIITTLNFAHAYNFNNTTEDEVPIPYSNQASIWGLTHVLNSPTGYYPSGLYYGYGLYRANFGWDYYDTPLISFYLDYRDCDFTDYYYGQNDIWIKFNASDLSVKIDWDGYDFYDNVTNVSPGSTYKIWIEKNKSLRDNQQNTNYFELYLCLSNLSHYPHLEWNPYHDTNILGYNVYRKITTSSGSLTYVEFTTDTFYTDYEFTIDPKNGDDFVEYWVKAKINQNLESLESNHRSTEGISEIQWKEQVEVQKFPDEFELEQNYPNPFNPITQIKYSIKEAGLVQLRVYDILGKEVANLVNENKEAGYYDIEFNASNLPSGVYICRLTTSGFTQARKMILTK